MTLTLREHIRIYKLSEFICLMAVVVLFLIVANSAVFPILIFTLVTIIALTIGAFFHKSFIKRTFGKNAIKIFRTIEQKKKQDSSSFSNSRPSFDQFDYLNKSTTTDIYHRNLSGNIYNSDL